MSSRIEVALTPSIPAGLIAALPWLALTAFLLVAAGSGQPWLLAGVPVSLLGAAWQFRRTGLLRGHRAVAGLTVTDGQLLARLADQTAVAVDAAGASRMGPRLTLLKLRPVGTTSGSYFTVLLAPIAGLAGNASADDFRRLRVWLRLGRPRKEQARHPDLE
ncbi:hypothetical protein [Marinobacter sp.]|uniref:hypothetical protein n=1 Tax=Marinobacter sp. TaxID=50741 RepID=UPI0035C6D522